MLFLLVLRGTAEVLAQADRLTATPAGNSMHAKDSLWWLSSSAAKICITWQGSRGIARSRQASLLVNSGEQQHLSRLPSSAHQTWLSCF